MPTVPRAFQRILVTTALTVASAGCGPGSLAKGVRGDAPTAADALGAEVCMTPGEATEPWTFDLDTTLRGELTTSLRKRGLVLVSYDCNKLKIVRGCKAGGDYDYAAYTPSWDVIELRDSDEIRASLSGGAVIAASIKAEMERGTSLVIAHGEIGMSSTTVSEISRDRLNGNSCNDVTHYVEVVHFGAFSMQTMAEARLGSAVEIFDQGVKAASNSSAKQSKQSGERKSCDRSSNDDDKPVEGCDAVVRVRLMPIAPSTKQGAKQPTRPGSSTAIGDHSAGPGPRRPPPRRPGYARPAPCPPGMVRSKNSCVKASRATSYDCVSGDADGCKKQCDRGSARSCAKLGAMLEKGKGVRQSASGARRAYQRACDKGEVAGCTGLAYLYSKGDGVRRDVRKAEKMFRDACRRGDGRPCSGLGQQQRVARRIDRAIPFFARACRLGYARACFYQGAMLMKKKTKASSALRAYERACRGADQRGCLGAAYLLDGKAGVKADLRRANRYRKRALGTLKYRCDKRDDAGACETVADYYNGEYGSRGRNAQQARSYYRKACSGGRKGACRKK